MKNKKLLKCIVAMFVITIVAYSHDVYAQTEAKRLPDGTIIYSDGSIRQSNGTMKYPKNTTTNNNGTRLPDGTIIYPNGNTNGTNYPNYPNVRYPRRATRQSDGSIIYPDGRIVYPDGTIRYPNGQIVYPNSGNRNNNRGWIPPGQAKKMYGKKSARDYAPGHNKDRDRYDDGDNDHGNRDNDHGKKNNGHGNGKHKD